VLRSFVKDSRSTVVCEEVKKDKGIKKNIVAREIMLEDYKDVLFTGIPQYRRMNMIRSELHDVYTITCNKLALSANDDKRVIMDDRISTKAIGHYSTRKKLPMNHSSYNRGIIMSIMYYTELTGIEQLRKYRIKDSYPVQLIINLRPTPPSIVVCYVTTNRTEELSSLVQ
jgi:hypothetical protein